MDDIICEICKKALRTRVGNRYETNGFYLYNSNYFCFDCWADYKIIGPERPSIDYLENETKTKLKDMERFK